MDTPDRPRCIRCGEIRPVEQLNGYDPLAPEGKRYRNAYCRKVAHCNSAQADGHLRDLLSRLNGPG